MQLDRTEITICQRSALELLDLSLLVLRRHIRPIMLTSALVGLPLLMLDVWAVAWMMNEDSYLVAEHLESPTTAMRWRHASHLVLLYVLQFPLVSLPTTVFLGNQIFYEPMPWRRLLRRLLPIAGRCVLVIGIARLSLVNLMMVPWVSRNVVFDAPVEIWLLIVVPAVAILFRACWPYAPEILGLELCPLRSVGKDEITYAQRSRGLHRLLMSEHFTRFIGAAVFAFLLSLMLLGTQLFFVGVSTGNWQWNGWFDHLCLPITMWIVGLFMAVFRFLSYLDSRIRLEGWEIELRLRAEAERLSQPAGIPVVAAGITAEQMAS